MRFDEFNTSELPDDIRDPLEDVGEVMDANFEFGRILGNKIIDIELLYGGVVGTGNDNSRVETLINAISSPDGYFERLIIDTEGNVIEGQHRLDAIKHLGAKKVPVVVIEDFNAKYSTNAMRKAVKNVGVIHSDAIHQIIQRAIEAILEEGSPEQALENTYLPGKYGNFYIAALEAAKTHQ